MRPTCSPHGPVFGATNLERKETTMNNEVIIKDTHRGLWYEDGVLKQVIGAGRYKVRSKIALFRRRPKVELALVDVRERELTIKGQEILTADKVALRVSVI